MKIIRLKRSILFLFINPENDSVKTYFIYFISWNCFVTHEYNFDLEILNLKFVKQFYIDLANDYTRKYRI